MPYRVLALVLTLVLVVTLATPAKAEAFDVLTGLAIAGAAVIVIVLIAYLVIANTQGDKRVERGGEVWLACAAEGCVTIPPATTPVAFAAPRPEAP